MFINTILLGLISLSTLLQPTHGQEADLQTCLSTAGIQTSFSSINSTFISDTTTWQGRVRPVPTAVAYPQTETDIVASLKCATEAGVKVSALNGGHSFVSYGMGGEDGALVLNMTAFQSLSYDETTGYLTVGGGSHVAPAATYLWKNYGAHFPHVRGNWVGIAGSTIGGGLGTTSRFLGTTLDNLVAVTMVLANGTIVTASDTENSDLFFAVRGAGSSFGVLLTLTLKTWKPTYPNVTKWTITMPSNTTLDSGAKALLAVQEYGLAESTPDEMYIRWRVTVPSWGGAGYFYGNPDDFASVIAPLMDVLPEGTTLTSSVADFWTMENDNTGGINLTYDSSPSRTFYVKAFVLTDSHPFTYESAVALYNGTSLAFARDNRTDISKSGLLDLWGSRSNSARSSTTKSNPSDGNLWIVRWEGVLVGTDSARGQKSLYTQDAVNYISGGLDPFLEQLAAEGGNPRGYANYRNSELNVEEWSEQLYPGGNYEKLKSIKAIVDPGELFNPNAQSIPAS